MEQDEVRVPRVWFESLLARVDRTQKYLDNELSYEERKTLMEAAVPDLCGYASSAETILRYNAIK